MYTPCLDESPAICCFVPEGRAVSFFYRALTRRSPYRSRRGYSRQAKRRGPSLYLFHRRAGIPPPTCPWQPQGMSRNLPWLLSETRFEQDSLQASEVQIAVIAKPYFAINFKLEEEIVRRDERRSFVSARRRTTPCSISLSTRRRTVVRELRFRRSTCLSVSGRLVSSA